MNAIIHEGKATSYWSDSIIVTLFKEEGEASDQNNYRGLKLTYHVLQIILLKEWSKTLHMKYVSHICRCQK